MTADKRAIVAALAMGAIPISAGPIEPEPVAYSSNPDRRRFNWFGSNVEARAAGEAAGEAATICARLKEFYARRPRPWRAWRGSQRTGRKAHR